MHDVWRSGVEKNAKNALHANEKVYFMDLWVIVTTKDMSFNLFKDL